MAKGGARARSGPAPDPQALRRDRKIDQAGWVTLPAEGRTGDIPEWPLSEPTLLGEVAEHVQVRELELWAREWRRPQAVEWERNGQELEVAMYVRSVVAAEAADAATNARTLVRQQQDALGLSLPGLARNRWLIAESGAAVAAAEGQEPVASAKSSRFKVIPGGRDVAAA